MSQTSIDQPEPWIAVAFASKCARNLSKLPKKSSIAEANSPVGLSPPSGDMFGQNTEWLMCPPRLKARFFSSPATVSKELASRASSSFSNAVLRPLT